MISSARHTIICILLILCAGLCVQAQTTPQNVATSSISGKVTIKGKPAVGVMVLASDSREGGNSNVKGNRARTDQAGNYRITNLPAGSYEISALTPALVPSNESLALVVSEGEQLEDVNISLVPGGVITGKITNSEDEPLIGEFVRIEPVNEGLPRGLSRQVMTQIHSAANITDDRGVYRAFGLPPGKYKVAVGRSGSGLGGSRQYYKEVFYPSVSDTAKATVIEVKEGSETNNVDIVVGRPVETFKVAGKVVDGETGKPIPNIRYGVGQRIDHGQGSSSSSSMGGDVTNSNGEFKVQGLAPGKYTVFTAPSEGSDVPPASVSFEVVDRDLTGVLIQTSKGSSLSGVIVLEGNERLPSLLSSLRICASLQSRNSDFVNSPSSNVSTDGAFRIEGVRSGFARLWLCYSDGNHRYVELVRVEHNGILQSETIQVKEREHVAGIRVVVKYQKLTGGIRGQLKAEGGELPPISQLWLSLWPLEENLEPKRSHSIPSPQLDARGRFSIEGLPAGHYRISVHVLQPGTNRKSDPTTQRVTVSDDMVTEVILTIKAKPDPDRD
jgi:protocatechuate 3,4-dioxygenase beta subunit